MYKKTIITIAVLFVAAVMLVSNGYASNARVDALGFGEDDIYILDAKNVFTLPSSINDYPNKIMLELYKTNDADNAAVNDQGRTDTGDGEDPEGGGIWKISDSASLMVYLNRKNEIVEEIRDAQAGGAAVFTEPKNPLDIIFSYDIGASVFALQLYLAKGAEYNDATNNEMESSVTSFNLGLQQDFGSDMILDVALGMDMYSAETKPEDTTGGGTKVDMDSSTNFTLTGRMFLPMAGKLKLVPALTYMSKGYDVETGAYPGGVYQKSQDEKNEESRYRLGVGVNRETDTNLFLASIDFVGISIEEKETAAATGITTKTTTETTGLPLKFRAGFESKMFKDWLIGRIGLQKWIYGEIEVKTDTAKVKNTLSTEDDDFLSLGLGIKYGNFAFDAVIYENNFFSGTYLLSGNESNLLSKISMSYNF